MSRYAISSDTSIVSIEKSTQQYWADAQVFSRTLEKTTMGEPFTFYDGPPFATGLPHYGHMLAGSIKDAITRYQTMQGRFVERRFGWDCHGVPIEHIIEKNAKEKGTVIDRRTIAGRADFNEQCRAAVMKYTTEWRKTQNRIGRFIDMDNDYKTMNPDFMESVWWTFKELHKKNLVYRGKRVVAYSPGLGTPLSDFEAKESYKTVNDPQVVVSFSLAENSNIKLLVWTTTPWTLLTNVGIAINQHASYVKVTTDVGHTYIMAESLVSKHFQSEKIARVEKYDAAQLVGKKYLPLFYTVNPESLQNAFTIVHSDHVTANEMGTGLVHLSPAFGEDDYALGQTHQLPMLDFFDVEGRFANIPDFGAPEDHAAFYTALRGVDFKEADKQIVVFMVSKGMIYSHGTISHEYPFCYRTDKPLMYRAIASWFVAVTQIKDRMLKNNATINWYPEEIGQKRFANWLEQARDWNVSRNRYWGTPLPIWQNTADENDLIVIGSIEELRQLSGVKLDDLHSHFADTVEIVREGKTYRRVPEVFDCWFESGSMPYAQVHYPFEHGNDFHGTRFPAHFIAEGLDQTRGWFYTLLILSTALYDKPPFLNCVVNGILLGNDGKKMSKSKGNYPSLDIVLDQYGADALRYVLLGSRATHAEPLAVKDDLFHDAVKDLLIPIMNLYKFYAESANKYAVYFNESFSKRVDVPSNPLDQWLLWRTETFKANMTQHFERYNLVAVCRELENFVTDFSKWYVRNIKSSLNQENSDKQSSLRCMHFALEVLSQCSAPVVPFMSEYIYRQLFGMEHSVHLCDWPKSLPEFVLQTTSVSAMAIEQLRKIVELTYAVRDRNNLPLSQPLPVMYLDVALQDILTAHRELLCRAVNVETIQWSKLENHFNQAISLNQAVLGKKLRDKQRLQAISRAMAAHTYALSTDQKTLTVCETMLSAEAGEFVICAAVKADADVCAAVNADRTWVVLDPRVTPELKEKANLRALEKEIIKLRKELKLNERQEIGIYLTGALFELAMRNKTELCKNVHVTLLTAVDEDRPVNARVHVDALNKEATLAGDIAVYSAMSAACAVSGMWRSESRSGAAQTAQDALVLKW